MFAGVGLSVRLSVSRITPKLAGRFSQNSLQRCSMGPGKT